MDINPAITAALIGAGAMMFLAAVPFFIAWGNLHARVRVLEAGFKALTRLQEDMAYARATLEGIDKRLDKVDGIEAFLRELSGWFQTPPPIMPNKPVRRRATL